MASIRHPQRSRCCLWTKHPALPLALHSIRLVDNLSGTCSQANRRGGRHRNMPDGMRRQHGIIQEDSIQAMKKSVLRLYPNPTDGGVWVEVVADTAASIEEENTIVVRNIVGQVVATSTVDADAGPFYLTLTDFAAGVYTVEYRRAGMLAAVQKLVKQ